MLRGFVAITALLLACAGVSATEQRLLSYGRHLARECTSCHRLKGASNGIPSLAGFDKERFAATLGFYQSGARTNPAMVSVAKSLDAEQIKALAAYFASLPKREEREAPAAKAKR